MSSNFDNNKFEFEVIVPAIRNHLRGKQAAMPEQRQPHLGTNLAPTHLLALPLQAAGFRIDILQRC